MTSTSTDLRLPDIHPFTGMSVWSLLVGRAAQHPDALLMTWEPFDAQRQSWTYAQFVRECEAVGAGLQARGIAPGDRIVIHLENRPEFLVTWFACAAIGAVAVTTNSRSSEDELTYFIGNCGARAAVTQPDFAPLVRAAGPELDWVAVIRSGGEDGFDALRAAPEDLRAAESDPAAPLSIQYTSGTTSRPKGVLWTHANGLWGARVNALHEDLRDTDVHLVYMPLFHTNAMAYSVLASIWVGARFVLLPKWSSSRFWEISLRNGCTWASLMGLSTRAILASDVPEEHSYRRFGAGADLQPLTEKTGVPMVTWWGMTETMTHPIVSDGRGSAHAGTMGRCAPEYEIAVRDPLGVPSGAGEVGELSVRGVRGLSLFAEYWNNPEATASAFDDEGWFSTGDLVRLNDDGTLTFIDRAKDMLKVGAENVAASEIERVVQTVTGPREIAVVGAPHEALDEVPVVFVVDEEAPEGLADDILAACSAQLADFKVPRQVLFVTHLPRSTISKVNKVELRTVIATGASLADAQRRWEEASIADPSGDAS